MKKALILLFALGIIVTLSACRSGAEGSQDSTPDSTAVISESAEATQTPSPTPTEPLEVVFEEVKNQQKLYAVVGKDNVVVLGNGRSVEIEGVLGSFGDYRSFQYSIDGSRFATIMDENNDGNVQSTGYDERPGLLVTYDGITVIEVASDVDSFRMSADGSVIAYLTGLYTEGVGNDLYLYDCVSGQTEKISEGAGRLFALSPTGKSIAFTTFEQSGVPDSLVCHIKTGTNDSREVVKGMYPVALTDDGSLVYTVCKVSGVFEKQAEVELWVHTKDRARLLCPARKEDESIEYSYEYIFNVTCSQVIFDYEDGVYFSSEGNEATRLIENGRVTESYNGYYRTLYRDTGLNGSNTVNLNTQNLYNVLLRIDLVSEEGISNYLGCFDETNQMQIFVDLEKYKGWSQSGGSILIVSEQDSDNKLMYIENIFIDSEPIYVDELVDFDYPILQTSNNSFVYGSHKRVAVKQIGEPLYIAQMTDTIDTICLSENWDYWTDVVVLKRDGQPDIIYYLEYVEKESTDSMSRYMSSYYHDLYMIEDIPGAIPVLISDNVGTVSAGEFGVYYLQLDSVSPQVESFYSEDSYASINDMYDLNRLFYSRDGETFSYVADQKIMYFSAG